MIESRTYIKIYLKINFKIANKICIYSLFLRNFPKLTTTTLLSLLPTPAV